MTEVISLLLSKNIIHILVLGFILTACVHSANNSRYDEYFYAVLDSSMESQKNPTKYDVIDKLYDLKDKSKNPASLLIDLLDYFIGAGGEEILLEFITEKGTRILPLLIAKKASPINCIPKYKSICVNNIKLRDNDIDWMIEAINHGKILRVEEPPVK
jgi:hypothetical protein